MCIRKSRFTLALLWAMIPVTVLGSVPRMGCICANGQHKFFCERHRAIASDARCVCCFGRDAARSVPTKGSSAVPGAMTCCGSKRLMKSTGQPEFSADRPCRPVLDRPQFVSVAKATLDLDLSDQTPSFLATAPTASPVGGFSLNHGGGDVPPPPDLVTTLGVLLI